MIFTEMKLKGAYFIELERKNDERGFFARSFCQEEFAAHGLNGVLVQGNMAFNPKHGTLRGMHFQKTPYQEEKLIRCDRGAIYDVIIDLRKDSPTYCQWAGTELTADNHKMIYVPKDFAHGYLTLKNETAVTYFMSQFYQPGSEDGVRYDDPMFRVEWPAGVKISLISERDKQWPGFERTHCVSAGPEPRSIPCGMPC